MILWEQRLENHCFLGGIYHIKTSRDLNFSPHYIGRNCTFVRSKIFNDYKMLLVCTLHWQVTLAELAGETGWHVSLRLAVVLAVLAQHIHNSAWNFFLSYLFFTMLFQISRIGTTYTEQSENFFFVFCPYWFKKAILTVREILAKASFLSLRRLCFGIFLFSWQLGPHTEGRYHMRKQNFCYHFHKHRTLGLLLL